MTVIILVLLAVLNIVSALALPETKPSFCGNEELDRSKRYAFFHAGHGKHRISYKITTYSKHLSHKQVDEIIERAFNIWAEQADISFIKKKAKENADIDLGFYVGPHVGHKFPDDSVVIAHAYLPYVHFNDAFKWRESNNKDGISLYKTAIHEIGHSLGLGHVDIDDSIMYSSDLPDDNPDEFQLHDDDIQGIRRLYGENLNRPPFSEDLCKDATFDTMFNTPDGKTYIFKKDKYYELNEFSITDGPKLISDKWKGLPESMNGAFTQNGKTFFFKNGEYWRFTGNVMDEGYPKKLVKEYSEIPNHFDGATVWEDGQVYFFTIDKVYITDLFEGPHELIKPKLIVQEWKGIPNRTDVVYYDNKRHATFFFKSDRFYLFQNKKMPNGFSEAKTNNYFFKCNRN